MGCHVDCKAQIEENWIKGADFTSNVQNCILRLVEWSKQKFDESGCKLDVLQKELQTLKNQAKTDENLQQTKQCENAIDNLLLQQEDYLRVRSRAL